MDKHRKKAVLDPVDIGHIFYHERYLGSENWDPLWFLHPSSPSSKPPNKPKSPRKKTPAA